MPQQPPATAPTASTAAPTASAPAVKPPVTGLGSSNVILVTQESPGGGSNLMPTVTSALLVVAGWAIVNKLQANRERRKQARERVAELKEALDELEASVIEYHTSERDKSLESKIIAGLARLERGCSSLNAYCDKRWKFAALTERRFHVNPTLLQQLRQLMTLKHFQDEHTSALDHEDPIVQHVQLASNELYDALEACRTSALD